MSQEFIAAFTDMREADALEIANALLEGGADPLDLWAACKRAMGLISRRFESGDAFVPGLVMAGEIMQKSQPWSNPASARARRLRARARSSSVPWPEIFMTLARTLWSLKVNGFEVHDLGVDVSPQAFVDKIRQVQPDVVGLSGLLTLVYDAMKQTVSHRGRGTARLRKNNDWRRHGG